MVQPCPELLHPKVLEGKRERKWPFPRGLEWEADGGAGLGVPEQGPRAAGVCGQHRACSHGVLFMSRDSEKSRETRSIPLAAPRHSPCPWTEPGRRNGSEPGSSRDSLYPAANFPMCFLVSPPHRHSTVILQAKEFEQSPANPPSPLPLPLVHFSV